MNFDPLSIKYLDKLTFHEKEIERLNTETTNSKKNDLVGERTNGDWQNQKEGFYYTVVGEMLKVGFTESDMAKVGGGNFCRVSDTATKGK